MYEDSIVGDVLNFRGLVYGPVNEQGVVLLFGMLCEDLNIMIEEIKTGFPDCIARFNTGRGWRRVNIEFEYKSSNFRDHGHDPEKCDILVCWLHDWIEYPKGNLDILCLKDEVEKFKEFDEEISKSEISEESDTLLREEDRKINDVFIRLNTPPKYKSLFYKIDPMIRQIDPDKIWLKPVKYSLNYYIKQIFAWIEPQAKAIKINYYTLEGWEHRKITEEKEIEAIIPIIEKSYEIIKKK